MRIVVRENNEGQNQVIENSIDNKTMKAVDSVVKGRDHDRQAYTHHIVRREIFTKQYP